MLNVWVCPYFPQICVETTQHFLECSNPHHVTDRAGFETINFYLLLWEVLHAKVEINFYGEHVRK